MYCYRRSSGQSHYGEVREQIKENYVNTVFKEDLLFRVQKDSENRGDPL